MSFALISSNEVTTFVWKVPWGLISHCGLLWLSVFVLSVMRLSTVVITLNEYYII